MLYPTHEWYVPLWYPTIHLIAAIVPLMGLLSVDGIFHLWTATLFIDNRHYFITSTTTITTTTKYPAVSTLLSIPRY